ncbi:MAG: hypothetical protein NTZ35_05040 [Ignavibacteriales bacterium]|nr:hypothetical protein [Ignavibacteriales bacterium]
MKSGRPTFVLGLRNLVESGTLLGPLPELFLVTVSIKTLQGLSTELSPKIKDSIPAMLNIVSGILDSENQDASFSVP